MIGFQIFMVSGIALLWFMVMGIVCNALSDRGYRRPMVLASYTMGAGCIVSATGMAVGAIVGVLS